MWIWSLYLINLLRTILTLKVLFNKVKMTRWKKKLNASYSMNIWLNFGSNARLTCKKKLIKIPW